MTWNPVTATPECDWCGECEWCDNLHRSQCPTCGDHYDPKSDDHCPMCHGGGDE